MDVAATEFFTDGVVPRSRARPWTAEALTDYYVDLADAYPIVTIEDALAEDDWDAGSTSPRSSASKIQLVGDDLFVTNPTRLRGRHQARRRQLAAGEGQPDRHAVGDAGRRRHGPPRRLHHDVLAPLGRDRGHHDRRPRRRRELGSDQERRARPQRARREIQSASAHRGGAGRRGGVRRPLGVPALHRADSFEPHCTQPDERGSRGRHDGSPFSCPAAQAPRPATRRRAGLARRHPPLGLHGDHAGPGRARGVRARADDRHLRRPAPADRRARRRPSR